ncbi:MAG: glycosyltransferase family 39 protein [Chloroflexota bacterium]|nr:glycosyltransferase family 39 protein [Chloroflexota bacterium]
MIEPSTQRSGRWIGVMAVVTVMVLILPGIRAWFQIINEWEIVQPTPYEIIAPTAARIESDLVNFGRFRPLFWLIWHAQRALLRDDAVLWHLSAAVIGAATLCLMFGALRRIVGSPLAALGVLLLLCFPRAGAIWYNLVYQETIGTLLIALAGYAAVRAAADGDRRWDALFALAAIASGFIKENYALLLPALIGMRVCLQLGYRRPFKTVFPALFLVVLSFGGLMAIIGLIFVRTPDGYGQTISSDTLPGLEALGRVILPAGLLLPLAAAVFVQRRRPLLMVCACGTLVLWLVPQVVLYNERIAERFLFPAVVGSAVGAVIALASLRAVRWRGVIWGLWALTCVPFVGNVFGQWSAAATYAAGTENLRGVTSELAASDIQTVVIQVDPGQNYDQYEAAYSVTLFLRHAGYSGRLQLYHPPNVPIEMLTGYVDNGFYDALASQRPAAPAAYVILTAETTWVIAAVCAVDPCPVPPIEMPTAD